MPLVNFCGFETGGTGEATISGTASIQNTTVRTGTYALQVNPVTTATGSASCGSINAQGRFINGSLALATSYHRFYFRIGTAPAANDEIFYRVDDKVHLRLDSSRQVVIYRGAAGNTLVATVPTVLALNTWYRIELLVSTGVGAQPFELRIDGVSAYSTPFDQTNVAMTVPDMGKPVNKNGNTVNFYYDDWAVSDSGFIGAGACTFLLANANGSVAQWTAGTGTSDWQEVNEIPVDTITYIRNPATVNNVDLIKFETLASKGYAGKQINGVKGYSTLRLETTATVSSGLYRMKSGATSVDLANYSSLSISVTNFLFFRATDPNTSLPWAESAINAVELGWDSPTAVQLRSSVIALFVDVSEVSATTTAKYLASLGAG